MGLLECFSLSTFKYKSPRKVSMNPSLLREPDSAISKVRAESGKSRGHHSDTKMKREGPA